MLINKYKYFYYLGLSYLIIFLVFNDVKLIESIIFRYPDEGTNFSYFIMAGLCIMNFLTVNSIFYDYLKIRNEVLIRKSSLYKSILQQYLLYAVIYILGHHLLLIVPGFTIDYRALVITAVLAPVLYVIFYKIFSRIKLANALVIPVLISYILLRVLS